MTGHDPKNDELRASGLRVTAPRQAVLTWLSRHPHATVDVIHGAVRDQLGAISRQAVYDVLAAFERVGLVRKIKPAGHPARFERRTGDNHHHLVCRDCGRIEDIDCGTQHSPCLSPGHDHGFQIDEAEVTFWGVCADCHTDPADTTPKTPDARTQRANTRGA